MKKNTTIARLVTSFLLTAGAIAIGALLSSCAYTETMNEREVEGQGLQKDLNYEIEKGNRLSR